MKQMPQLLINALKAVWFHKQEGRGQILRLPLNSGKWVVIGPRIALTSLLLLGMAAISTHVVEAQAAKSPLSSPIPPWGIDSRKQPLPPYDGHGTPKTLPGPGLYVAMGDSITFGYGASVNCKPFPTHPVDMDEYCPNGTSYAALIALALRKRGVAGHAMNLGINGATVDRVMRDELPYLPENTTLVTLYVGTNDSRGVQKPEKQVMPLVEQFERDFDALLDAIHAKAPNARIILVNFPNESYINGGYHIPDSVLPRYDATSQILDSFIDDHYPRYAVADTACDKHSYDYSLLYRKTVHPNDAGSVYLANRVLKAIRFPKTPRSSCKWFARKAVERLKATP
jgi:lysophospholipase L1-like esterase